MEETIFSKIIKREIPADIVYENDAVIAFLDIAPVNQGGTLVVPKKWSRNILDIDSETWGAVMEAVRVLMPIIKIAMNAQGMNFVMNNEPAGNQVIFHTHVHIIPRFENDHSLEWSSITYEEGEQAKVAEKIRAKLDELNV